MRTMRMRLALAAAFLQLSCLGPSGLSACTLWGVEGQSAGGGTLIAKNRDWRPDQIQKLSIVRPGPGGGHAYLGLFADSDDDPKEKLDLKAGVNDAGLCVVTASADAIPRESREKQTGKSAVAARLLSRFATVEGIRAEADRIFSRSRAVFLMIADRKELLSVEVGLDGKWSFAPPAEDAACHTNHYLAPSMGDFNERIGRSSGARLERIKDLLARRLGDKSAPLSSADFREMSKDSRDGPDDGIWRSGREWTLASWILKIPDSGDPRLDIEWLPSVVPGLASEKQDWRHEELVLDSRFWRAGEAPH